MERGVDEKKVSINSKRPFDLYPAELEKKINEEHKSQASLRKNKAEDSRNYKGKSEEGFDNRARNY